MMREIGSEFWTGSAPCDGSGAAALVPPGFGVRYVLCGRTALDLVISDIQKAREFKKAYLPSYCCHTMIEPFISHGIAVEFYNVVLSNKGIVTEFEADHDCDVVYLLDYFGFINDAVFAFAEDQSKKGKTVIYDSTHSMFCRNMDYSPCDYVFGSFRKWFGVNAGFCAKRDGWIDFPHLEVNGKYTSLRNGAFDLKRQFIDGEPVDKSVFLNSFAAAEDMLEEDYRAYGLDERSKCLLQCIDVESIRKLRRKNAEALMGNLLELDSGDIVLPYRSLKDRECPLFVPICVRADLRDDLRKHMIDRQIYLPIHWPVSKLHNLNDRTAETYYMEMSCVCDQRYTTEDMGRIIAEMRGYLASC